MCVCVHVCSRGALLPFRPPRGIASICGAMTVCQACVFLMSDLMYSTSQPCKLVLIPSSFTNEETEAESSCVSSLVLPKFPMSLRKASFHHSIV